MTDNPYRLKACPVVLRTVDNRTEILAFLHPEAGKQVVKGTIDPGENPEKAALRELTEESGIDNAAIDCFLEEVHFHKEDQIWHIFACQARDLPEAWSHIALEGDGNKYEFKFFWHDLADDEDDDSWHYTFQYVLNIARRHIGMM